MQNLCKVKIEGFKSIAKTELSLNNLNIVIGANGSGKSNLIGVFRLLERVFSHNLQLFVASQPDRLLHHGRKVTPALIIDFVFEQNESYGFTLKAEQDRLFFEEERVKYNNNLWGRGYEGVIAVGHKESHFREFVFKSVNNPLAIHIFPKLENSKLYHFHDTSDSSPAKRTAHLSDNRFFRSDAGNLPAYLYWLKQKHPINYRHIVEHVRLVAPFFDDFILEPLRLDEEKIKLEWQQKGSDAYFDAYSLSDGTLRFICLATLLLQPTPPFLILLDEPELGLHPFAIRILAEMLEVASKDVQVLLATQSVTLLNHFSPKDVIIAENDGLKTQFRRLPENELSHWLGEFSLGELWEKNVLGGRP
ncbi:AAA family ATPase [Mycoavidus sp. SF9855]|uniref:AAA family ATPase n=1 Tax=Mycoavidus sp. SF9855 TaxID=2968475 RepID=UPI00211B9637|nr:AAA family ATPase [Mycoavidus sp. SF9855]UUM21695.1 AAA family ATPase [Mycoavidus sp. SF9855]